MSVIHSLDNGQVKHVVALYKNAARKQFQEFVAQGQTVIGSLYQAGMQIKKLYCTQDAWVKIQDEPWATDVIIVSDAVMAKMSNLTNPTNVLALFGIPHYAIEPNERSVVLYNIQDPGNVGTLIRSAAAFGIENVFVVGGADPYQSKIVQSSAGTLAAVRIISCHWHEIFNKYQDFCALVVHGGQSPDSSSLKKSILVFGNEGQGLPEQIVQQCRQRLTIDMPGNVESLNVAVAGSIALYLKLKS